MKVFLDIPKEERQYFCDDSLCFYDQVITEDRQCPCCGGQNSPYLADCVAYSRLEAWCLGLGDVLKDEDTSSLLDEFLED